MRTERRNLVEQQSIVHTFFRNDEGKVVLMQTPNVPLIAAMISSVLQLLTNGKFSDFAGAVFFGSIFTWAWLEIASGVSMFRRVLGVVVMMAILWTRI